MKKQVGKHEKSTELKPETLHSVAKPAKEKNRRGKRAIITFCIVLAVVAIIFVAVVGFVMHYSSKLNVVKVARDDSAILSPPQQEIEVSDEKLNSLEKQLLAELEIGADWNFSHKDVTNILLIGEDNDYIGGMGKAGNADGLIIVSINKNTKQIVLTSIMRDLYVYVPHAYTPYSTKITLSYHFGGTQTLIDVVEKNLGIPIDNYILVNYLDVIKLVDAVGGLTFDVDVNELYFMQEKIHNLNALLGNNYGENIISTDEAGTLTLNGVQTAAYMRIRKAGNSDFERTERARSVILGLVDKAMDMNISELNSLANEMLPCITTDLEKSEILSLLLNAPSYLTYEMVSSRIPIDGSCYFDQIFGSTLVADMKVNKEYLYKSIYEGVISEPQS